MRLSGDKWLLDDKWSTNGTHQLTLTTRILGAPKNVVMTDGNNYRGVDDVVLDAGNNCAGVRGIDSRNGWICVSCKCLLEAGS